MTDQCMLGKFLDLGLRAYAQDKYSKYCIRAFFWIIWLYNLAILSFYLYFGAILSDITDKYDPKNNPQMGIIYYPGGLYNLFYTTFLTFIVILCILSILYVGFLLHSCYINDWYRIFILNMLCNTVMSGMSVIIILIFENRYKQLSAADVTKWDNLDTNFIIYLKLPYKMVTYIIGLLVLWGTVFIVLLIDIIKYLVKYLFRCLIGVINKCFATSEIVNNSPITDP